MIKWIKSFINKEFRFWKSIFRRSEIKQKLSEQWQLATRTSQLNNRVKELELKLERTQKNYVELQKVALVSRAKAPAKEIGFVIAELPHILIWLALGNHGVKEIIENTLCNLVIYQFNQLLAEGV